MIPDSVITQIRETADIVQVIGQHIQLKKVGRSWKGLCPFHGEKTPSFHVYGDKGAGRGGYFKCYGCQKHGDVLAFVMELEGKTFVEAAEQIAARFGIEVPRVEESPELRKARGERVGMLDINKLATQFFREVLADPVRGEPGRAYLAKRGVSDETAASFQLGYAPADWGALADYLQAKRADLELAVKVGLVAPRPRSGGYYDRYRDRLVCPVIVPGGDVVGFSARVIGTPAPSPDGSEPPKYINSPESTVYKKSKLLFGLAQAREAMQAHKRAVLVEGNFDVITLHQAGFDEVIAPLGTALTIDQVLVLKRLAERVVLLYDGDRAGYKATMHALQMCVEADVEVLVAKRLGHGKSGGAGILKDGVDPDSLVAGGGAGQLREAVDRAQGGIEFFAFEVWSKARASSDARARALEDATRLVAKVASPIKRDLIVATLATAMEVDVGVVRNALSRQASGGGPAPRNGNAPPAAAQVVPEAPAAGRPQAPPPTEEVELLALFADHPQLIATAEADKAFWLLTDARLQAMYSAARGGESFLELASANLPPPSAELVLSGKYTDIKSPSAVLATMTHGLEGRRATGGRAELKKSLAEAGRSGDRELARTLALLATAERKGDVELIAKLRGELAKHNDSSDPASTGSPNRKQVD